MADTENIKQVVEDLEKQELESPGGVSSPQVYAQLLAIYLFQNDLCNAKYLWKRIPQNIKTSHAELGLIWKVGQRLWMRDFPGVYTSLAVDWSENVSQVMQALLESTRKRAVNLVSHAYSSISADDLAAFVGMPADRAASAVVEQGWNFDSVTRTMTPSQPVTQPTHITSNEDQLYKLTDFVSFLEN
uniref:COP9 signalosome complex subunit 8 n=1 Tax=Timema bartmani TaxID=61472 RepID=A0A7R9HWJ6_9NEOP|nr:unnamed protein product [Timema bartmani]